MDILASSISEAKVDKQVLDSEEQEQLAQFYKSRALADSTKVAYLRGWGKYQDWAQKHRREMSIPLKEKLSSKKIK